MYVSKDYLVIRSSHLTIPSIMPIEIRQNAANTAQHIHCSGNVLSIVTPIAINKLPIEVAVNHKPWQIPCKWRGAIFDTNDKPRGEINNSATVKKKYVRISTNGLVFIETFTASERLWNSKPDG